MPNDNLRRSVKGLLGTLLWPLAVNAATRLLIRKHRGLVLTFHYIGSPILPGLCESLYLPPSEFTATLDFICSGLRPLPPEEFLNRLRAGTLPEKATLITFDDCSRDTLVTALPELRKRNLAACFFVCPGLIDSGRSVPAGELMAVCAGAPPGEYLVPLPPATAEPSAAIVIDDHPSRVAAYRRLWPAVFTCPSRQHARFFDRLRSILHVTNAPLPNTQLASWEVLAGAESGGGTIGNHTMVHSTVSADGESQFESDVALAYSRIERHFGPRRRIFGYPYGGPREQPAAAQEALRRVGTEFGFVMQGGTASWRPSNQLTLHREDATWSAAATKLCPGMALIR